jgi:xanthine dehydrogenase molybdopterin-binding subunit B
LEWIETVVSVDTTCTVTETENVANVTAVEISENATKKKDALKGALNVVKERLLNVAKKNVAKENNLQRER